MKRHGCVFVLIVWGVALAFVGLHTPGDVAETFIVSFAEFDIPRILEITTGPLHNIFLSLHSSDDSVGRVLDIEYYESIVVDVDTKTIRPGLLHALVQARVVREEINGDIKTTYEHIYYIGLQRSGPFWKVASLREVDVKAVT